MKVLILILLFANTANATIANYNAPEILARANIYDGYNIPAMSFLNNASPVINNRGDVSFKIVTVAGVNDQALWVKTAEDDAGQIVYTAPDKRYITEPSLNDTGKLVFSLFDEGVTDGLFFYDTETSDVEQVLNPDDLAIQDYTYPQVLNNNSVFFRATDDNNDRSYYQFSESKLTKILTEGIDNLGFKTSYIFRPSANENGQMSFKARMGEPGKWDESNPDSIILLTPSIDPLVSAMKATTIARDQDSDSKSIYKRFGNSVSISSSGAVAFMGYLADSKKAIVLSRENTLKNIAVEGHDDISEIEMFTPKINDQGLVLFRAKNMAGLRGLYLADGSNVKRLIGEGDEIETDLGAGMILFNPNFPGFGGEVDINDQGEIVFHCIVVTPDNKELGSAVYKMTPNN
jgi:hypothetical protein